MRRGVCLLAVLAGCTHTEVFPDAGPRPDASFPPANPDFLPPIGSDATLEIATWNIENFPATITTPSTVADIIASLDLDVVVVEEIASRAAWDELLLRLPSHDGVLSPHEYAPGDFQKLGVIYKRDVITVGTPELLFPTDGFAFPRPPFVVPITVATTDGGSDTIELVGVHLKAGVAIEDAQRRTDAVVALDRHLRAQVDGGGEPEVVLLGDYNQRIVEDADRAVLAPILGAPDRYTVRTEPLALDGASSFLGFDNPFLDHITTTAALDARWSTATVQVAALHVTVPRYTSQVSDHLPVILIAPR